MFNLARNTKLYKALRPGLRSYAAEQGVLPYLSPVVRSRAIAAEALSRPIWDNVVLFESYAGRGVLCNPAALYRTLLKDPQYNALKFVWAVEDPSAARIEYSSVVDSGRTKFVKFKSDSYYEHLARAKYLINNVTFPMEFNKRPDQIYLNTWHGTPLKSMGVEVPNGIRLSRNVLRNFLHADFLLSSGPQMTELMYRKAYQLQGIYSGKVIEAGAPRVDAQIELSQHIASERQGALAKLGVQLKSGIHTVILFAPTWRGQATYRPDDQSNELLSTLSSLNSHLEPLGITVILKAHQLAFHFLEGSPGVEGYLVNDSANTNTVLGAVDGLITDYSSIAFDYLAQRGPLFWHIPDSEAYSAEHGLRVDHDELYGSVTRTVAQLAKEIESECTADSPMAIVQEKRWRQSVLRYAPHDGPGASRAIVETVFGEATSPKVKVESLLDSRHKILFYPGGLENNGITSSALSLLRALDTNRFDITVIKGGRRDRNRVANLEKIPSSLRILERIGSVGVPRRYARRWRSIFTDSPQALFEEPAMGGLMADEVRRVIGSSTFDSVIDFSGYTPFWQALLLHVPADRRITWQHNDLLEEMDKEVRGVKPHAKNLLANFQMYPRWDAVCSVSQVLADVNRRKLAPYIQGVEIDYVPNIIDATLLNESASVFALAPDHKFATEAVSSATSLEQVMAAYLRSYGENTLSRALDRATLLDSVCGDGSNTFVFLSAGRFSPEKNHYRLLTAFAEVHRSHPNTRLVLCGNGPLFDETVALANTLNINDSVSFPGHVSELPYLFTRSDCFVLSSDHEGQPIVVLEALALSVPSITTEFDSAAGLPDTNAITVVERSAEALACAMERAASGELQATDFDMDTYTARAIQRFENLVHVTKD